MPHGVFDREAPRDEILLGIPIGELRLDTRNFRPDRQCHRSPPQLQDVRVVFDVVDGDHFAASQRETEVEPSASSGLARRNHHEIEGGPGIDVAESVQCLVVILFTRSKTSSRSSG